MTGTCILCTNIKTAIHVPSIVPLNADIFASSEKSFSDVVLTDSSAMVVDDDDGGSNGDCSRAAASLLF
jgi:hypothetical protein